MTYFGLKIWFSSVFSVFQNSFDLNRSLQTFDNRRKVLRSAGRWSVGLKHDEDSVYNAYCHLIEQAQCYVYIENQFFVTATEESEEIDNKLGHTIAERIIKASKKNENFRMYLVTPVMSGGPGKFEKNTAQQQESKYHCSHFGIWNC